MVLTSSRSRSSLLGLRLGFCSGALVLVLAFRAQVRV